jgi:hypothetical protein
MSDIFEKLMLRGLDDRHERTAPIPEAIIERMREAAPRFTGPCQFGVDDVVTARSGSLITKSEVGVPYLVIATDDTLGFVWDGKNGTPDLGARVNMRVLTYEPRHDAIVAMWVDSANFELFAEYQDRQVASKHEAMS